MLRTGILALLLVLAIPAAALAAVWTVQVTPNPAGAAGSRLSAVSCGSDTSCVAVGSSTGHGGADHALAEIWNGSTWTIGTLAALTGWRQSSLSGVSCTSGAWCMAVGSATDHAGKRLTLAERWNGVHWTIQQAANPSPAVRAHELTGVSCVSANACVAVGEFGVERFSPFYTATFNGLIERWNGRHWSVQDIIHAPKGTTDHLNAVSCKAASSCLAVGGSSSNNPGSPLAWRWDGHHWRDLHPPNHGEFAELLGVSCSSGSSCTAVGHFFVSRDQNAIAERWNGARWTVQTPPRPTDAGGAELSGVSCLSGVHCSAVGGAGPADPSGGLAEDWDGLHWTIRPTPGGDGWPLAQVSCRPTFCAAVGYHDNSTLAERYS